MVSETAMNHIEAGLNKSYELDIFDGELDFNITDVLAGSKLVDNVLVDASGNEIDPDKLKIILSVLPEDIEMSDEEDAEENPADLKAAMDELTAASASLPRKFPTIKESAVLYSC